MELPKTSDIVVIGTGFHGVYIIHQLRKHGFSVQGIEASSGLGGVWHSNRYPGLVVDIEVPHYEFAAEDLWSEWIWNQRYPSRDDLSRYFAYVDAKWDISSCVLFNSTVTHASFGEVEGRNVWRTTTHLGDVFLSSFIFLCTGYGSKPYIPSLKGLEHFQGLWCHSSRWPDGFDVTNKRVGVIGTGATGVQIIQSIGAKVSSLTVFQRTPNHALPMHQRSLTREEQEQQKTGGIYTAHYLRRKQTFSGSGANFSMTKMGDVSPEGRHDFFEHLWKQGGLHFWDCNYGEVFTDMSANLEAYAFWRDKVRARITDRALQEKLAPDTPIHPFGAKRPSLEMTYFEVYNQNNVTLIDVNENPIAEVTPQGIITLDGIERELDVFIMATGFDAVTGGILDIDIRGAGGSSIQEKWKNGVSTHLGLMTHGFPNMFIMYGPQSPCPFSIGPASAEVQGEWLTNCLLYLRQNKLSQIEAIPQAEQDWRRRVREIWDSGLWSQAQSWYTGANVPGKIKEPLAFGGSLPVYRQLCNQSAESGYEGFILS